VHAVGDEVRGPHEPVAHDLVAMATARPSGCDPASHDPGQVGHVVSAAGPAVELLGAVGDLTITMQNETSITHVAQNPFGGLRDIPPLPYDNRPVWWTGGASDTQRSPPSVRITPDYHSECSNVGITASLWSRRVRSAVEGGWRPVPSEGRPAVPTR